MKFSEKVDSGLVNNGYIFMPMSNRFARWRDCYRDTE